MTCHEMTVNCLLSRKKVSVLKELGTAEKKKLCCLPSLFRNNVWCFKYSQYVKFSQLFAPHFLAMVKRSVTMLNYNPS